DFFGGKRQSYFPNSNLKNCAQNLRAVTTQTQMQASFIVIWAQCKRHSKQVSVQSESERGGWPGQTPSSLLASCHRSKDDTFTHTQNTETRRVPQARFLCCS